MKVADAIHQAGHQVDPASASQTTLDQLGRTFFVSALVTVVLLAVAASPAVAAWSIVPSPNVAGAKESALEGVSCAGPAACVAVGSSVTSGVQSPLAEILTGGSWRLSSPPLPSGAKSGGLTAISCWSETGCTAVGTYVTSSEASKTLAERWNGSEWAVQATASGSSTTERLAGVSCNTAKACIAVGSKAGGGELATLAERWNGKTWSLQTTPNPSGFSRLNAVSCSSAKACTTVGSSGSSLAERWNGTEWVVQKTANREPSVSDVLTGVSCDSAKACEAVGSAGLGFLGGLPDVSIAEGWNGTEWALQTPAGAPGEKESAFAGVSCGAVKGCTAAGAWDVAFGEMNTLANFWNGTGWSFESTPNPPGGVSSQLKGLSCPMSAECVSVGNSDNGEGVVTTLIEAKS